jgi:hypothetical protein
MMASSKYENLIYPEPLQKHWFVEGLGRYSKEEGAQYLGAEFILGYNLITEPLYMVKSPHKHSFHQYLVFIGGNPMNMRDFGGEVDLWLGVDDEAEMITVNKTTIIHIPPMLPHCPLNFRVINKPIIFMECMLSSKYDQIEVAPKNPDIYLKKR